MTKLTLPAGIDWPIPEDAALLIAMAEQGPHGGVALKAYRCPAGVWTYGLGETEGVGPNSTCTEAEGWEMLRADLVKRAAAVRAMCPEEPGPCELGAMVSLAYNIGNRDDKKKTGLYYSSVLKAHNRGDAHAAAQAFLLYNKARVGGVLTVEPGLTSRRHQEAALYLRDAPATATTPQSVAPAPSMAASPTVQTGAAMTVTGTIAMASAAGDQVTVLGSSIKAGKAFATDALGIPPDWFLPTVMVLGGLYVVWRRYGQRLRGLA